MKPCTFPGCEKPSRSRELCRGHYSQLNRGRPLLPLNVPARCTFDGCDNRAKAGGLCDAHDKQRRRGTPLHPLTVRRSTCTFPGCDRKHYARGACATHYTHLEKYGEMLPIGSVPAGRRTGPQGSKDRRCTFPGCEKPHRARGYCSGHYDQVTRGSGDLRPLGTYVRKERPRKERRAPKPKVLPAGWERTAKVKPAPERRGFHKLTEVPQVSPTDPALMRAALGVLRRHGAEDLADALGLSGLEAA